MRRVTLLALILLVAHTFTLHAEDADEVREKGIAALKESQTDPHAIVEAARLFVKAGALYGEAGNEEKNVEMNSFLYWCKKKMTLEDINAFIKGGDAEVTGKLAALDKIVPKTDDAQKWFDRADQFAKKNPTEHLLIAVRFFEVADRFKGSDASFAAQERSLKEQLSDKNSAVKTVPQPTTIKPTETVANDIAKRPIPQTDDLKTAERLIKDLLKADYVKTDAAARQALIAKLLQQADENKNDAALVYVCLHESRDLAVLVGDVTKAAEVQLRLSDSFKSDFAAILLDLRKLESSAKTAEPATALAALFAFEAERALAEADYDQAVRFNSRAEDLLPLSKDAALKARLKTEIPRVQAIKRDSVAALAAQKTLATKPDDAEANLTAGKFALLLGEVEKSMAMLAKSKDGVLSALAKRELAPPQEATEQTLLADGWFERAEKEASAYLKTRMQERAALWYTAALPGLTGVAKLKVEARIKLLPQMPANTENSVVNTSKTEPASPDKKESSKRWISKSATYKVSSVNLGYGDFSPKPALLNGEEPPYSTHPGDGFSFGTIAEDKPWITIDLGARYRIDSLEITNRRGTQTQLDRAKTLTIWVSNNDSGPWTEVWRAKAAALNWTAVLANAIECRFVKLGLREKNEFHLASIKIFGDELAKASATPPANQPASKTMTQGEVVTLAANNPAAYEIGALKKGSTVTLQYVDGKWKEHGRKATDSPDTPGTNGNSALVIAEKGEGDAPGEIIATVPTGTEAEPFVYRAEKDIPNAVLRIKGAGQDFKSYPGSVKYRVLVSLPLGAASPPKKEGVAAPVTPPVIPAAAISADTPFVTMLGTYSALGGGTQIPFINLAVPNGENIYTPELKILMAEKLKNGEVQYRATAKIYIVEDGTYIVHNRRCNLTIDGVNYGTTGIEDKKTTEVKLAKGVRKIEISAANHGQPYIDFCGLTITNKDTNASVVPYNSYGEIIQFMTKNVGKDRAKEVSNWNPATAERAK